MFASIKVTGTYCFLSSLVFFKITPSYFTNPSLFMEKKSEPPPFFENFENSTPPVPTMIYISFSFVTVSELFCCKFFETPVILLAILLQIK